jgi:hypothetical protein
MTDTDDVAAAQMFLQRRLEMIWNSALWRDSLLEATLTINPDDTTTLSDSYWISERSVLLLPAAIEKVIAARLNTNILEASSLESYYRTDTDWLDYQGTPFEFQVLKPVVMEWASAQMLSAFDTNAADSSAVPAISCNFSYSPDGVTISNGTWGMSGNATPIATALQLFTFSKPVTQGNVMLSIPGADLVPSGAIYPKSTDEYDVSGLLTPGAAYLIKWGPNDTYFNYGVSADNSTQIHNPGGGGTSIFTYPAGATYAVLGVGDSDNTPVTATISPLRCAVTVQAARNNAPMHQRIRLTEAPTVSTNLRVLGKGKCPILGPYDSTPITNAEPALMAFARGDLLLRQRQFGKAALAQQEGASLLKELVENEAFQQAGEFRIQPDGGFGSDIWWRTQPDSYHPL